MRIDWSSLDQELRHWRAAKLDLPIWWRDDDAISHTTALDQLTRLSQKVGLAVHLATIPKLADQSLVSICQKQPNLIPLVHGWAHTNHAPEGAKKAEFGHERPALRQEAAKGLEGMRALFDTNLVEIFVPPWNRIESKLFPELAEIGYWGLSTFTPRSTRFAAPGLEQINTHVDPINWRGGGSLVPAEEVILLLVSTLQDRRFGKTDATEPMGILTHHLVHDQDIWRFVETCIARLLEGGARPVDLSKSIPKIG